MKKPNKFAALTSEAFILAAPENVGGRRPPISDARLTVNIDARLKMRFQLYAVAHAMTMGELIEEWIEANVPGVP